LTNDAASLRSVFFLLLTSNRKRHYAL